MKYSSEHAFELAKTFEKRKDHDYYLRAISLAKRLKPGEPEERRSFRNWFTRIQYTSSLKRKEERRILFQKSFRARPWFYQTRFSADYGSFKCTICNLEFYHSPSKIYKAQNKIYNCVCGYCTNSIIKSNLYD
jgi:hypothetical protein